MGWSEQALHRHTIRPCLLISGRSLPTTSLPTWPPYCHCSENNSPFGALVRHSPLSNSVPSQSHLSTYSQLLYLHFVSRDGRHRALTLRTHAQERRDYTEVELFSSTGSDVC
ncbi:Protein phosphatase inhibitor [Macrophomina phaseolina MS6]|uniref:Protein phosphatase inhibitor n=1 Tax=Macrophomina phaseolina (strain MS6) TaxID=1126212 RepID=K2SG33_MACPH|nr:Protein phosphatase inhibitor [Macrophomina phaseolina MS6]